VGSPATAEAGTDFYSSSAGAGVQFMENVFVPQKTFRLGQ